MLTILQTEEGILHLLCRYEVVAVNNLLVILVDTGLDLVKFHVDIAGHDALSCSTTAFGFPEVRLAVHLATELALCSIHCDATHYGVRSILL